MEELTGQVFNDLTAVRYDGSNNGQGSNWLWRCGITTRVFMNWEWIRQRAWEEKLKVSMMTPVEAAAYHRPF